MHRATPSASSSASSSSSAHRPRKRHLTREQLLKSLQILGPVSALLPSELPPSPPASREPSPAPNHNKRRHDSEPEHIPIKRARTSSVSSSRPPQPPSRPVPLPSSCKHEPSEDGEVREDLPQSPTTTFSIVLPVNFPVRRPRRGANIPPSDWEAIHEKCFDYGRKLKYSAYARVAAAHSTTHRDFKALRVEPAPNSGYAQHRLLMARLELVDSLLHFVYGLWCKEYCVRTCYRASWRTTEEAIVKTEAKWQAESVDEREKAFAGLIQLIHAYIHGRKLRHRMGHVDQQNDHKLFRIRLQWEQMQKEQAAAQGANPDGTPKMLPSPASTTGSSNSTPLAGHGTTAANNASPSAIPQHRASASSSASKGDFCLPPNHVHHGVNSQFLWDNKSQSGGLRAAVDRIERSQATLNLPILLKHFPRTFARVMNTTLSSQDEHEPDFQDDECELYWPGQVITGEGLGWLCLIGMSMVKEFGREYGYQGVDGVVPKLSGDADLGHSEPRFLVR